MQNIYSTILLFRYVSRVVVYYKKYRVPFRRILVNDFFIAALNVFLCCVFLNTLQYILNKLDHKEGKNVSQKTYKKEEKR